MSAGQQPFDFAGYSVGAIPLTVTIPLWSLFDGTGINVRAVTPGVIIGSWAKRLDIPAWEILVNIDLYDEDDTLEIIASIASFYQDADDSADVYYSSRWPIAGLVKSNRLIMQSIAQPDLLIKTARKLRKE